MNLYICFNCWKITRTFDISDIGYLPATRYLKASQNMERIF